MEQPRTGWRRFRQMWTCPSLFSLSPLTPQLYSLSPTPTHSLSLSPVAFNVIRFICYFQG